MASATSGPRDLAAVLFVVGTAAAAAAIEAVCGVGSEQCPLAQRWPAGAEYAGTARCFDPHDGRVRYGDTVLTVTALTKIAAVAYLAPTFVFGPVAIVAGGCLSYTYHSDYLMAVFNADSVAQLAIVLGLSFDLRLLAAHRGGRRPAYLGCAVAYAAGTAVLGVVLVSLNVDGRALFIVLATAALVAYFLYLCRTHWRLLGAERTSLLLAFGAFLAQAVCSLIDGILGYTCSRPTMFESMHTWNHVFSAVALIFVGRAFYRIAVAQPRPPADVEMETFLMTAG